MSPGVIKKAGLKNKPISFNQERPENKGNQFNTTDKEHVTWQKNFWYVNSMGDVFRGLIRFGRAATEKTQTLVMVNDAGTNWEKVDELVKNGGDTEERCMKDQHETN